MFDQRSQEEKFNFNVNRNYVEKFLDREYWENIYHGPSGCGWHEAYMLKTNIGIIGGEGKLLILVLLDLGMLLGHQDFHHTRKVDQKEI